MNRIIIYCVGTIMKNYLKYIKSEEIVCFVDNYSEMRDIYGRK